MPPAVHEFFSRLKSLFRKRRMEQEMAEELEFHQAQMREKLMRQGVSRSAANQHVQQRFGRANRWQERLRELWQFRGLENFWRDVTFSIRLLKKSPGFTAVALLTLALGVGANTAVFSLVNALLLRPLPVPHSEQLVVLRMDTSDSQPEYTFVTPFLRSMEKRHDIFSDVFAYDPDAFQVHGNRGNENVPGVQVSGQFFSGLQTPPLLGRYLTPEDDVPGGSPAGLAVVISESFWKSWFDRSPDVIGRKLILANTPFTVVGVMPERFIGADQTLRPQIYAPISADPILDAPRNHIDAGVHAWWLSVVARLRPGMTLDQANAALATISSPILHEATDDAEFLADKEREHLRFAAEPSSNGFSYARVLFRKPLVAMFSMCAGILVLACINLASLLLARGTARERELATRLAMGATRRRLIEQLMVECLLIAVLGTGLGLAAGILVSHSLAAMLMDNSIFTTHQLDTSLDLRVFLFAACVAIAATLLIGLVPALHATGGDLNEQIKEGQHASKTHERKAIFPKLLMAIEVALALVLVAGAGLLASSLIKLYRDGVGFNPDKVVNLSFSMDKQQLDGDRLIQLYRQIGDELSHQPGVKNISFQFIVPLSGRGWNGRYGALGGAHGMIFMNSVAPQYFETMRIPMLMGRDFRWSDTKDSGNKIILNQAAAKLLFPDREALGQQVVYLRDKTAFEVIAVVGNTKYRQMRTPAPPSGYIPMQQGDEKKPNMSAVIRIDGPLVPLLGAARSITARLAPTIPAPVMTTMSEVIDRALGTERMMAILGIYFAGCALLVTAIGLYGTLAYATARRTSEIGIRMALGAKRTGVVSLIFRENAVVAIIGSAAGLVAALLASRALASFLYETSPRDPWVLVGSVLALTMIASAASLIPAIRAARIDPIAAIRYE